MRQVFRKTLNITEKKSLFVIFLQVNPFTLPIKKAKKEHQGKQGLEHTQKGHHKNLS